MCVDPVTLGIITTVVSTAVSAIGSYQQAEGQKAQYEYQAAVSRNNALASRYQAEDARKRGKIESEKARERKQQLIGRQRSIYGAAGLQLDSGTPLLVQEDAAEIGELDALNVENNFEREAYAHLIKAQNHDSSAALAQAGASSVNPGMAVATSLLSGASGMATQYAQFKFYGNRQ